MIMEEKIRCQSCGMPLSTESASTESAELGSAEFGNFGTENDGLKNSEFCRFCYKDGRFVNPDLTLEEMIQSSIEHMTADLKMSVEQASELANSFIPALKRWNQ